MSFRILTRATNDILRTKGIITSTKQIRYLYSIDELGVKNYAESRKLAEHAIANHEFFKQHFRKQLANVDFSLTSLEYGLKNLLHIMGNNINDITLLRNALGTFIQKRKDAKEDTYNFGTIIMRACHFFNIPDEAKQMFEDPVLGELFFQVTGHQILLDLLYENEKYKDVLRIYNKLDASKRLYTNKYIDVIVLATYYKLNTPDSFNEACTLWDKISAKSDKDGKKNQVQFRKSRTFVAALALNQQQPKKALQILEGDSTFVTYRHLKLVAWARTGQYDEIVKMLNRIVDAFEENNNYKPLSSIEVLDEIQTCIKLRGTDEVRQNFVKIRNTIESLKLVTSQSLDEMVCSPFPTLPAANVFHKKT